PDREFRHLAEKLLSSLKRGVVPPRRWEGCDERIQGTSKGFLGRVLEWPAQGEAGPGEQHPGSGDGGVSGLPRVLQHPESDVSQVRRRAVLAHLELEQEAGEANGSSGSDRGRLIHGNDAPPRRA